jgi:hypothetical protein
VKGEAGLLSEIKIQFGVGISLDNTKRVHKELRHCVLFRPVILRQRRMVGWLMTGEVERIWNEAVVAYLRQDLYVCVEGVKKTTKDLSLDTRCKASLERYQCAKPPSRHHV